MWRLFCRARRCGRRARDRCRPSPGRAGGGERRGCAATRSTSRSRSRRWRWPCPRRRGPRSPGAKERTGELASRFARTRVRAAHADTRLSAPREEEWLLIEWPEGEPEPTQYWLSTLPEEIGFADLVDLAQLRWRIERDYQDLKQEVGLGHYEGRGWRGFHHHATLCIAAYGFPIAERARLSPSGPDRAGGFEAPRLSEGYRPRGTPDPARTARAELDRDRATAPHRGVGPQTEPMPVLRTHQSEQSDPTRLSLPLVTQ